MADDKITNALRASLHSAGYDLGEAILAKAADAVTAAITKPGAAGAAEAARRFGTTR